MQRGHGARALAALISLAGLAVGASAQTRQLEVTQEFELGWHESGWPIYSGGQEVVKRSRDTGFSWGAYAGADSLVQWHSNETLTFTVDANEPGDYVYTVFSENGDNVPTLSVFGFDTGFINLSCDAVAPPEAFRFLVRDAAGDWYLSTAGTAVALGLASSLRVETAALAWERVTGAGAANLAQLDNAANSAALTTDPSADSPDLSEVTGGGVYIEEGDSEKIFRIRSIAWSGGPIPVEPVAEIRESFTGGWTDADNRVYLGGAETVRRSQETNHPWGAWAEADDVVQWHSGGDESLSFAIDTNAPGSYAYTLFGASEFIVPTSSVLNMESGEVEIATALGSDPERLRLLLRNAAGEWFLSDPQSALAFSPTTPTATASLADFEWLGVTGAAAENMNQLNDRNDSVALTTTALYSPPDLSEVTGGGFYIDVGSPADVLRVSSIVWRSGEPSLDALPLVVETFDTGWKAGDDAIYTGGTESVRASSDTGFGWGGRVGAAGDLAWTASAGGALGFSGGANEPGDYCYTVFSANGDDAPTSALLNMARGQTVVVCEGAADDQALRLLVRDARGDWYLSTADTAAALVPGAGTARVFWSGLDWEMVTGAAATNMNAMDDSGQPAPLTTDPGRTAPDLSKVTGGGLAVERGDASSDLLIASIEWTHGAFDPKDDPFFAIDLTPPHLRLPSCFEEHRVQIHTRLPLRAYATDPVFTEAEEGLASVNCRTYTRHCKSGDEGAWWPSEVGAIEPLTNGEDVALRMIDRAHRNGLRIIQYHRHMEDAYMADLNPDWVCVYEDGTSPTARGYYHCLNSPYLDYFTTRMLELTRRGADGFYFDEAHMPIQGCWCAYCRARFTAETGLAHPVARDDDDPVYKRLLAFQRDTIEKAFAHYIAAAHAVTPNLPMLVSNQEGTIRRIGHSSRLARMAPSTKYEYDAPIRRGGSNWYFYRGGATMPPPDWDAQLAFHWTYLRDASQGRPPHYWFNDTRSSEERLSATAAMLTYGSINNLDMDERTIPDTEFAPALLFGETHSHLYARTRPVRWAAIHFSERARYEYYGSDLTPFYENVLMPAYQAYQALLRIRAPIGVVTDQNLELGELMGYKVLILPDTTFLTDVERANVDAFRDTGGVVVELRKDARWWTSEATRSEMRAGLRDEVLGRAGMPPLTMRGGSPGVHAVAVRRPDRPRSLLVSVTNDFHWMGMMQEDRLDGDYATEDPGVPPPPVTGAVLTVRGVTPRRVVEEITGQVLTPVRTGDGWDIALPSFPYLAAVAIEHADHDPRGAINETFAGSARSLFENGTESVSALPANGFGWGGYGAGSTGARRVELDGAGALVFDGLTGATRPGSYACTIFSARGDAFASSSVVHFHHGFLRAGVEAQGAPVWLRFLVRDAVGDWYLSTAGTAVAWTQTASEWKNVFTRDLEWERVNGAAAANLNEMNDASNAVALTTDASLTTPALAEITGGGVYLHAATNLAQDVKIHGLIWRENRGPAFSGPTLTKPDCEQDSVYAESLSGDASDPDDGDIPVFSKQFGPSWLEVAADGALSGTPGSDDVGLNEFVVRVADGADVSQDATLFITVNDVNDPPAFSDSPVPGLDAAAGWPYRSSLAGQVSDPDNAVETLAFSKISGDVWLEVSPDGSLGGTPPAGLRGVRTFTVRVTDPPGLWTEATLEIDVVDPPVAASELTEPFTGGWQEGGAVIYRYGETVNHSLATGWGWGGYVGAELLLQWHSAGNDSLTFTTDANEPGDYCYTIFSDNGEAIPTRYLHSMWRGEASATVAGGSNPERVRLLVRDRLGAWYLSGPDNVLTFTGSQKTDTVSLGGFEWVQVVGGAETNMNEMGNGLDSVALTFDPSSTSPDLSAVTGGGLFIETGSSAELIRFDSITWRSGPSVAFQAETIVKPDATAEQAYRGQTLAGEVDYGDPDALTFAREAGPSWLRIAADGALSGTPAASSTGLNSWTVSAKDPTGIVATATLEIQVRAPDNPGSAVWTWMGY